MNDWRDVTLGHEIELAYGKSLPAHARRPGRISVFGSNGRVGTNVEACVDGPGIVVGRKGSVGEVTYSADDFWPIDTTYYVVNKGNHNWRFLYHLLRHCDLTGLNSHSAVPGLNREDAYSLGLKIPQRGEQDDIARVLDCIESSLQLEFEALTNARELKLSCLRELFTRGLRSEAQKDTEIGPVPASWAVVPLGSLGRIGNGSTPKKTTSAYWDGGRFPWLTSAKVYEREIEAADQFVSDVALAECHLPRVKPGAVLMAITGQGKTLGHCAVLKIEASVSQHVAYLQTDTDKADPSFIRGYLETQYEYLRQVAAGGGSTKGALTCAFLRDLPVPLPGKDEQREIVTILDAIDRKSDLHYRKRQVLENLFKSLLHQLMTNDISVSDLDLFVLPSASTQRESTAA